MPDIDPIRVRPIDVRWLSRLRTPRLHQAAGWAASLALLLQVGCGGGGGSGEPGALTATDPPATVHAGVTFEPSRLVASIHQGDDLEFLVVATTTASFSGPVHALVVDDAGVIEPTVNVTQSGRATFRAGVRFKDSLATGAHRGNLKLMLCTDAACTQQHPGSPWSLPFDIEVASSTRLTPLSRLPGARDGFAFQGDAGHAGYVPVSLDPSRFTRRWVWSPPLVESTLSGWPAATPGLGGAAVADGAVFVATRSTNLFAHLYALNESDGATRWTSDPMPRTITSTTQPTVVDGRVFFAGGSVLRGHDAGNGSQLFEASIPSAVKEQLPPVVAAGQAFVYTPFMGLVGFDTTSGSRTLMLDGLAGESSTAAADATGLYLTTRRTCPDCDDAGLGVFDSNTGALVSRIEAPGTVSSLGMLSSAPVLSQRVVYVFQVGEPSVTEGDRFLVAYGLDERRVLWRARVIEPAGSPAVGGGVVYVAVRHGAALEARSAATGERLWTWFAPRTTSSVEYGRIESRLLLTDNLVFFSAQQAVHAVDLSKRASVWSHPRPGELSMSANGTLLISTTELGPRRSWLHAINLQ